MDDLDLVDAAFVVTVLSRSANTAPTGFVALLKPVKSSASGERRALRGTQQRLTHGELAADRRADDGRSMPRARRLVIGARMRARLTCRYPSRHSYRESKVYV